MGSFGVVELEGAGDRVEDGCRDAGESTAFQFGVVLDAHPGECGDLATAQAGHATGTHVGEACLLGSDLGSPRDEELAYLGPVVHANDSTTETDPVGMPYQYTF
jgi:hypothetical protein